MPHFSVIIPTFNGEYFIAETIESVLNQTFTDFEIIIVNDGSTDNTSTILKKYQLKDPRIKVITIPNSGGPTTPMNVGIMNTNGKYIAFLDHDDLWHPSKLEIVYSIFLQNPYIGFVGSNVTILNEKDTSVTNAYASTHNHSIPRENILAGKYFNTFSMLVIRRTTIEKVGMLDTNFFIFADYEMIIRMTINDIPHIFLEQPLITYRVHQNNTSSLLRSADRRIIDLEKILIKYEKYFKEHTKSLSILMSTIGHIHLLNKNKKESSLYFKKAIYYDKYNPLGYIKLFSALINSKLYYFLSRSRVYSKNILKLS